ncbi:unnamed protein product [Colias eurytheme]|nr:unnamed protein product [Colias eurytheme]
MALLGYVCCLLLCTLQCVYTRQIPPVSSAPQTVTIRSPANLSYEELSFILKTRHGLVEKPPKTLTPCARAILGCCDDKKVMNESCSESLKCGAFFFDDNPCEDKFIIDALKAAKNFYEQFNKV